MYKLLDNFVFYCKQLKINNNLYSYYNSFIQKKDSSFNERIKLKEEDKILSSLEEYNNVDIKEVCFDGLKVKDNNSQQGMSHDVAKVFSQLGGSVVDVTKCVDNLNNLNDLYIAINAFNACELKKIANKTVIYDGNSKAKVMLIGEAPGYQEDLRGIPFCGESGALLDEMFRSIDLNRMQDIYITNTIFWRPPANRVPSEEEINLCRPFVEKHISLINPHVLILVGATAIRSVLQDSSPISFVRGKFRKYQNRYLRYPINVTAIYHPSYLLRQGIKKKLAWLDLLEIKNFLSNSNLY